MGLEPCVGAYGVHELPSALLEELLLLLGTVVLGQVAAQRAHLVGG